MIGLKNTCKTLNNTFPGSHGSAGYCDADWKSEVFDKVWVPKFCLFLTRRGAVTNLWSFSGFKNYFKKKKDPPRVLPSVHLISLNKKHGLKCFRDLFEIKHTDCFYSCIFRPLPYIVISEIGIRFSTTHLVRAKFILYRDFHIFGLSFPWKYRLR